MEYNLTKKPIFLILMIIAILLSEIIIPLISDSYYLLNNVEILENVSITIIDYSRISNILLRCLLIFRLILIIFTVIFSIDNIISKSIYNHLIKIILIFIVLYLFSQNNSTLAGFSVNGDHPDIQKILDSILQMPTSFTMSINGIIIFSSYLTITILVVINSKFKKINKPFWVIVLSPGITFTIFNILIIFVGFNFFRVLSVISINGPITIFIITGLVKSIRSYYSKFKIAE